MAASKPRAPFHVALHQMREGGFIHPATIAARAGLTLGLYMAMELGHAPYTTSFYDAAVHFFQSLRAYPRPGPDPVVITPTVHPAVEMEYQRIEELHGLASKCNFGGTHKNVIRQLLLLALAGRITAVDIERYFGS